MPLKIAMIGAGSIGFTRRLMQDILAIPELTDTSFALMDLSQSNLDMVKQLCERDIAANHLPAKVTATTNQREATDFGSFGRHAATRLGAQHDRTQTTGRSAGPHLVLAHQFL